MGLENKKKIKNSNSFFCFYLGNHESILQTVGFEVRKYRYWSKEKLNLDIDGFIADLEAAPEKSVIILHACAVSILHFFLSRTSINIFFSTIQPVVIQRVNNGYVYQTYANLVNYFHFLILLIKVFQVVILIKMLGQYVILLMKLNMNYLSLNHLQKILVYIMNVLVI